MTAGASRIEADPPQSDLEYKDALRCARLRRAGGESEHGAVGMTSLPLVPTSTSWQAVPLVAPIPTGAKAGLVGPAPSCVDGSAPPRQTPSAMTPLQNLTHTTISICRRANLFGVATTELEPFGEWMELLYWEQMLPVVSEILIKMASGATGADTVATDEMRLLERVRASDLKAFEALYRAYHPRLARFVGNLIHRPQLVQEVLNDTMLVVWERPDSFRGDSKLSTWIFGIAYRKAMKAVRRHDEPVEDEDADARSGSGDCPEDEVGRHQSRAALQEAIAALSPDHRAVVDLTYFHEIGYREIAEIVGCPVDTVKTRMFHARRHLKRKLAGNLADWL